ncbi:MAG: hypothetical protein ACYSUT_07490 [Planctomycetota bacterium]|jgi:hypothetical protein
MDTKEWKESISKVKMNFKIILLLIVLGLWVGGCMSPGTKKANKNMAEAYSAIALEDGINKDEAEVLAETYFTWYISGCGATSEAIDNGDQWEVKTFFGVAAKPYSPIYIDKQTGKITCSKGPTISAPTGSSI